MQCCHSSPQSSTVRNDIAKHSKNVHSLLGLSRTTRSSTLSRFHDFVVQPTRVPCVATICQAEPVNGVQKINKIVNDRVSCILEESIPFPTYISVRRRGLSCLHLIISSPVTRGVA
uniref:(northern house mosquito) hypothetical protein n=1 Tax=Culex pipiens TaxID=7175 RepID=A0A8D8BC75_CULPI